MRIGGAIRISPIAHSQATMRGLYHSACDKAVCPTIEKALLLCSTCKARPCRYGRLAVMIKHLKAKAIFMLAALLLSLAAPLVSVSTAQARPAGASQRVHRGSRPQVQRHNRQRRPSANRPNRPSANRPNRRRGNIVVVNPRRHWRPGGAIAAGAAIGFIAGSAAVSFAGPRPHPGYCWFYTNPQRTRGFWDICPR
jgi:hypothetical protein